MSNGARGTGEDPIKRTAIALLTFVFIGLYVYGIYNVWNGDSETNTKALTLLQPIVYVIIGYYFGRMPSEKVEKQLKDEAKEKDQKADQSAAAANRAEARLRSVRTLLVGAAGPASSPAAEGFAENLSGSRRDDPGALKVTVAHAINVIDGD